MAVSKLKTVVKVSELGEAISTELTMYSEDVVRKVNEASKKAVQALRDETRKTAPADTRWFRSAITCGVRERNRLGNEKYIWYVNRPRHRLTHLLVHGHMNVDGSRTPGDPFLHNAWESVRKKYEQDIEEALKSD